MGLWSNIIRHGIAPLWARWEGSPYLQHYRTLLTTQYHPPAIVQQRQWRAVSAMVRHAYETTPFWRERLDRAGLRPERIRDFRDFEQVPVLTKDDLRRHGESLLSREFYRGPLNRKITSGSTGISVTVYVDEAAMQFKRACTLRSDEWSGWRLGEPVVRLWGHPPKDRPGWRGRLRNLLLDRTRFLDTLGMDEEVLESFCRSLRRSPPSLLFGHAHSLYLLAEYLRERGGAGFRPRGIIATAMVLHSWQRRLIEDVFQRRVINRYGCEEVSLIACECEQQQGLHVNADGVYVELLREGRPVEPGEPGSVVVTDLSNRAMPLLRYQVGDVAVAGSDRCPCGRGLPLLERLEGREADYVVTPAGRLISGISLTDHFACQVPGAAQMQIVQETPRSFVFRIVRAPDFGPESVQKLAEMVREFFGPEAEFTCEFVARIPQEPSGKYRFCISKVASPFARPREVTAR